MRAQHNTLLISIESVPHVSCRVIRRHVQKSEVIILSFHFRRAVNLESHIAKDPVNLAQGQMEWMDPPAAWFAPRQGHIQGFFGKSFLLAGGFDAFFLFCQGCFQPHFYLVHGFADQWALIFGNLPHRTKDLHHQRGLAKEFLLPGIQLFDICGSLKRINSARQFCLQLLFNFQHSSPHQFVIRTKKCPSM